MKKAITIMINYLTIAFLATSLACQGQRDGGLMVPRKSDNTSSSLVKKAGILLLSGQSNTVGFSGRATPSIQEDSRPTNFFMWSRGIPQTSYVAGNYGDIIPAAQPSQASLNQGPINENWVSWGYYLGREFAIANPTWDIINVNSSRGSTGFMTNPNPITGLSGAWSVGGFMRTVGVSDVHALVLDLQAQGYTHIEFLGLAWHQGESNSTNPTNGQAAFYQSELTSFVNYVRSELDVYSSVSPSPLLVGTMAQNIIDTTSMGSDVNSVHTTVSTFLPNSSTVNMSDLPTRDGTHFTGDALREAGAIRMWNAYQSLDVPGLN